jgi:uncharacterized protein
MSPQQPAQTLSFDEKYHKMQEILRELGRVAVAFSAGVDSTLVLRVAVDTLGSDNVIAVTGRSDSLAEGEFEEARRLAAACGVEHVVLDTAEFSDPRYLANPADRCYFCKTELYDKVAALVADRGLNAVVSGTNADDYDDWRPGLRAAAEHRVRSPCAEAGMTKGDIRELSRRLGLPTFDKPAMPCLSSRVQIGEHITPDKLKMVERGEAFLRSLGLRDVRVRHHGKLARVEVSADRIAECMEPQMRARIDAKLREIGYTWVAMDMRGFRSGAMNEALDLERSSRGEPADDKQA